MCIENIIEIEKRARMSTTCPVCGVEKEGGENSQIVCWGECWRGRESGLKYTQLTTERWLFENYGRKLKDINILLS